MFLPRISWAIINKLGERGLPCFRSLEDLKNPNTFPLRAIEYMQLRKFVDKITPHVVELEFDEACQDETPFYYNENFLTYQAWQWCDFLQSSCLYRKWGKINIGSRGFSLSTNNLEMILWAKLQRLMGWRSWKVVGFGILTRVVEKIALGTWLALNLILTCSDDIILDNTLAGGVELAYKIVRAWCTEGGEILHCLVYFLLCRQKAENRWFGH